MIPKPHIFKVFVFAIFLTFLSCKDVAGVKIAYLAHTLPTNHPVHKGMVVFADEVAKISGGKLKIKIFPDGQLGSEREVLELLQIGSIAITKVSSAAMSSFAPEYKVLSVPYLFRDNDHLFKVLEGEVGKNLLASGSDFLLKGLCFYDAGSRSFYAKSKPIREPDDLKGMKIRVQNDQMAVDMINAMGGSATPMAYGELYTALQQGVVDGAENNPPSFVTSKHYEVCKYYTLDEHSSLPDVLVISTNYWQSLTEQEQAWMQAAANTSVIAQKILWKENVEECMAILKEAGVEIIIPDKEPFKQKTIAVQNALAKDPKMAQIINQIINQ
jgi:tripartite ATP-independent transporter DctP family solute receptor